MRRAFLISFVLLFTASVTARAQDADESANGVQHNRVAIHTEGDKRIIESNGMPDHKPGQFPNRGNPNSISEQHYKFEIAMKPQSLEKPQPIQRYLFGIAVNGVVFDPGTAEIWQPGDKIVSRPDPGTRMGPGVDRSRAWNYEGMGRMNLGIDTSHAHVQPTGAYHYHGLPTGLIEQLQKKEGKDKMLLIGYAADGYPIYAEQGHTKADDATSPLKKLQSSYKLKEGNRPTGDNGPGGKYDGTFVQDFEFKEGSGDLDQSNGRTGVTPEYPEGTYYYVVTDAYPFIPRSFHSKPDASFEKQGPPGGPGGRPLGPPPRGGRRGPPPFLEGASPPVPREHQSAAPYVLSPKEAKAACSSTEQLGKALERRWPMSAIKEFCILERRHNPHYQLLVLDSDVVWRGTLHSDENTGYDKIRWHATTSNGRLEAYSIVVERGDDLWELEFGSEQTLTHPPDLKPDPTKIGFANHTKPLKVTPLP